MGNHHHGHALPGQLHHHVEHLANHFGVQRRSGLIKQHDDRIHAQRAGDGDALLLPPRKLARKFVLVGHQPHAIKHFQTALPGFVLIPLQDLDLCQSQVFGHGQVRKEFEMLEHHPHMAAQLGQIGGGVVDLDTIDCDLALLDRLQPIDGLDQRGFAGTGRPAHHDDFTLLNGGGAVVEDLHGTIPLADVFQFNHFCSLVNGPSAQRTMATLRLMCLTTEDSP